MEDERRHGSYQYHLGKSKAALASGSRVNSAKDGVLDSINEKLQRIRELTVQGLNGTVSTRDSDVIQAEINFNLQEIDRLAETVFR